MELGPDYKEGDRIVPSEINHAAHQFFGDQRLASTALLVGTFFLPSLNILTHFRTIPSPRVFRKVIYLTINFYTVEQFFAFNLRTALFSLTALSGRSIVLNMTTDKQCSNVTVNKQMARLPVPGVEHNW
ncbi:hypothetical protein AVEN_150393-1 [Araneus ventricosus]|uniref:Uncharacterized protein n=1 Tax=Araneus ventricosus TaxID=182803 RepID=A0A4Y2UQW9_ARAVE|nr:hypothetical protein AVEN_150393-1 [Araneus ventricosus]